MRGVAVSIGLMGLHPLDPRVLMAEKAIRAGCRRLYIREASQAPA